MDQIFSVLIIIFSIIIHEVAHGYVAYAFGDSTAKYEGRLTLNPLKHIDLFGSVILPILLVMTNAGILFGWAKPVPYNPYNLRHRELAERMIALAGPASNFILALIFVLVGRVSAYYNLVSIDFLKMIFLIVVTNIVLGVFNLVPIPPLDGSKIFNFLLPKNWRNTFMSMESYGMVIVLLFIVFSGGFISNISIKLAIWLLAA